MPTMHSAGQLARQASIRRQLGSGRPRTSAPDEPQPVAGGIAVTDLIILALSALLSLLRSLPLAELLDFIVAAGAYTFTTVTHLVWLHVNTQSLPRDGNRSPASQSSLPPQPKSRARHSFRRRRRGGPIDPSVSVGSPASAIGGASPDGTPGVDIHNYVHAGWQGGSSPPAALGPLPGPQDESIQQLARTLRSDLYSDTSENIQDDPEAVMATAAGDASITLFHHVVLVLARFACENFPFLVPRVLLAEETVAPFVRWRTGGGAGALIRDYGPDSVTEDHISSSEAKTNKNFRAYWIGGDSHLSPSVRRSNPAGRQATTILWIHGGGFLVGSVAFYAEALLRILAKVCALEHDAAVDSGLCPPWPEARCVAIEYSLGPGARFPDALLECLHTYAHLLEVERIDPEAIVLAGDSAGGNLALAMLLALSGQGNDPAVWNERDWSRLPMPGKAVLVSPWVDLRPNQALAFESLRSSRSSEHPSHAPDAAPMPVPAHAPASPNNPSLPSSGTVPDDGTMADEETESEGSSDTAKSLDTGTDYLVPEGLLHFAQLYSGVLDSPRRVNGPAGWIAGLLRQLETTPKFKILDAILPEAGRGVSAFGRTLSSAVLHMLDAPLFERPTPRDATQNTAMTLPADAYFGLTPLFGPSERISIPVPSSEQLFEARLAFGVRRETSDDHEGEVARLRAAETQANEPLMSPASGDWSRIKLARGMMAVYGSHELLAPDIQRWCDASGARSVVQHGPGGVHAWPLVNMYIAGSSGEREKGLDVLASAMACIDRVYSPPWDSGCVNSQAGSSLSLRSSSGSMPSDAWGIGSPGMPPDTAYTNYPADYSLLFGGISGDATPSGSSTISNSDREEDNSKLSGIPMHRYPPPRLPPTSSSIGSSAWWANVAASPPQSTHRGSPDLSPTAPAPQRPVDTLEGTRLDGLSDITEETEMGTASSRPDLATRAGLDTSRRPIATATATATAGTALASPLDSGPAPQVQGLGTAGDMLRAYLEIGPSPTASTPPVAPSRRRTPSGDVWW